MRWACIELAVQGGWWLPQDARLRGKRVRRWRRGKDPWALRREEVWMLEWKGLLWGLWSKCWLWGLGPNPGGWEACWDPRREVVLWWRAWEVLLGPYRKSIGCGQRLWLGNRLRHWKAGLGNSWGRVWPWCCMARDRGLHTVYCGGSWPNCHG